MLFLKKMHCWLVGLFCAVSFYCHAVSLPSCVSWKILWSWRSISNNRTGIWLNKNAVSCHQSCIRHTQITSSVSPCLLHWLTEFVYLKKKIKAYLFYFNSAVLEGSCSKLNKKNEKNEINLSVCPFLLSQWPSSWNRCNLATSSEDCRQTGAQGDSEKGFVIYFTEG